MNFKKIIIGITIFAVGLCGTFLAIEKLKPSNNDSLMQETTAAESKSDIAPVAELKLTEPPLSLEMITVQNTTEDSTQPTSEDTQEESTTQETPSTTENNNWHYSQREYVQQTEAPADNNTQNEYYEPAPSPAPTQANTTAQEETHQSSEQANTANDNGNW